MSIKEPYIALGCSVAWIIARGVYLGITSKSKGKEVILSAKPGLAT